MMLDEPVDDLDMRHAMRTMLAIRPTSADLRKTAMIVLPAINFAACHTERVVAMNGGVIVPDGVPTEVISAETATEVLNWTQISTIWTQIMWSRKLHFSIVGNELETEIRAWEQLVRSVREPARTIIH